MTRCGGVFCVCEVVHTWVGERGERDKKKKKRSTDLNTAVHGPHHPVNIGQTQTQTDMQG